MSCGCGCCPKCGCRATCTCNNSLDWSLESRSDFSYIGNPMKTVAGEHDEHYSFNGENEHSSQSDYSGACDELEGAYAKKGSRGSNNYGSFGGDDACWAGTE